MYYGTVLLYEFDPESKTFYNVGQTPISTNKTAVWNAYANIPNPASQLIEADSEDELYKFIEENITNMKTPEYLEEYVFPYL